MLEEIREEEPLKGGDMSSPTLGETCKPTQVQVSVQGIDLVRIQTHAALFSLYLFIKPCTSKIISRRLISGLKMPVHSALSRLHHVHE